MTSKTHMLVETPDGEQMLVLDLRGHRHVKVLERNVTVPRLPGVERRDGRWRLRNKEATKLSLLCSLPPLALAKRLRSLEARLDKAGL